MTERVVVIGAGMAGLFVALALAPTGREITLYERDPPPPEGGLEEAFEHWSRRGVGHLRHSHGFLARLENLIAREHPALLDELRVAGVREFGFVDSLPADLRAAYRPKAGDADLNAMVSRRTTLECVMRRHVEALANVTLKSEVFVRAPIFERRDAGLTAVGLRIEEGGEARDVAADLVIDAGGKGSDAIDALADAGVAIPEEDEACAILYYTRFYRLRPDQAEPSPGSVGTTGDLGYLKFGVFRADARTFSVTLAVPEVEETLRGQIVRPEVYERICELLPGIAPWTDPERAEPITRVLGMGDLTSRWREFAPDGRAVVLNYFPVGDSLVRTNPLYGRGCTFAAVEAHLLRDALGESADPADRLARFSAKVREALRPYYDDMVSQDRGSAARALNGLNPDHRASRRARLAGNFAREGVAAAVRADPELLRQALRAFHMLDPPGQWAKRPATLGKAARTWIRRRLTRAPPLAVAAGPRRGEMFTRLGLSLRADYDRRTWGDT